MVFYANALNQVDGYKVGHISQYPVGTQEVYSNFTPRYSIDEQAWSDGVIFFGLRNLLLNNLLDNFEKNFFGMEQTVCKEYFIEMQSYLGVDIDISHIEALYDLQYLPLEIKALPEGTLVPYGVPVLTVRNTLPEFFWLTNYVENLISVSLWKACTTATTAFRYYKVFKEYEKLTMGEDLGFVPFQGHDFSFRGMSCVEDAAVSGSAHLVLFKGTDTIPAIEFLRDLYYEEDLGAVGMSVPATEHSVMCAGTEEGELETFRRLIEDVYPSGVVSIVSDTWDLWQVLTEYIPTLKDSILARDGKVVIRPDSGDPVKIICGDPNADKGSPEHKGVVQLLDEIFGHTLSKNGFKTLNDHVGVIYGDSITLDRQERILAGLAEKGYSSYNVVLGIGSFTYNFVTRDTHGWAMKATSVVINGERKAISKDPKTGDGKKKSAVGLLKVVTNSDNSIELINNVSEEEEKEGLLKTVFLDGEVMELDSFETIQERTRQQA